MVTILENRYDVLTLLPIDQLLRNLADAKWYADD